MEPKKITVIKPTNLLSLNLKELWDYRELFLIFGWRDIKVRYKQTMLGIAWAVFQPLITMIIFSFFFGKLAQIPSGNLPYALFVLIGLSIWSFFSSSLTQASSSLLDQEHIVKKVYFPRIIVPLASTLTSFIDFGIVSIFVAAMVVYFGQIPNYTILLILPFLMTIMFLTSSGLGLFMSSLNIKYRDVRYILPFFIQLLMFLTPVIYPSSIIASQHKFILILNPLSSVIETARLLISGSSVIDWQLLTFGFLVSLAIFAGGVVYFKKTEAYFADII